jgi:phage terminase large subunit
LTTVTVEVPEKFEPLLRPARYKGAHGGRGGAKSHFFAEQLILRAKTQRTRWVCIREIQQSIRDSVRQLLVDKIQKFGWEGLPEDGGFRIMRDEIHCPYGGLIIFRGMQDYNAANIKSLEDFDGAWIEEGQTLRAHSWNLLRPTIRKEGSEIWVSWNPRHDNDPVDEFFRGKNRHPNAVCVEVNWRDNPWFPGVLREEMEQDFLRDPEMAEHVWSGGYEIITEGAYYARALADAEREGRVGHFPYNPGLPLRTAWDLGVRDYTSIWFIQDDGVRPTVVDFYEISGDGAEDIIATALPEIFIPPGHIQKFAGWDRSKALELLGRDVPFKYTEHLMPHDIRVREWGGGARQRIQVVQELGMTNIRRGASASPEDRVQAVRSLLPMFQFNDTPRVRQGLKRLRNYKRRWNDGLGTYTDPIHDDNSHASDAFGEFAINSPIAPQRPKVEPRPTELELVAGPNGIVRSNMSVREIIERRAREQRAAG